jgi:hypothetical protein
MAFYGGSKNVSGSGNWLEHQGKTKFQTLI